MAESTKRPGSAGGVGPSLPWWGLLLTSLVMCSYVGCGLPEPIVWVAVPTLVGLLILCEGARSLRESIAWLLVFGTLTVGGGYYWLAGTVQAFGQVPAVWSWLLLALFGLVSGVHMWVFAFFYRRMLARGRRPHPLTTCALIVGIEHLPIRLFAWKVGNGAVDAPALAQAAEWGGVSAVTFVLCCLVVPLHEWLRWTFVRHAAPARPKAALVTFLVGVALFVQGGWRLAQVRQEEEQATRRLKVAIVQPNKGSVDKRKAERNVALAHRQGIDAYRRGSQEAVRLGADLIVWPETAITDATPLGQPAHDPRRTNRFLASRGYGFLNTLGQRAAFLVGIYEQRVRQGEGPRVDERYNTASLRAPGGLEAPWQVYRKVHLIPFGEYMPVGSSDMLPQRFLMLPGDMPQKLLELDGTTMAPFLCYEGILAGHIRALAGDERPDLLVSLTNDSWFGDTWEPYQHLQLTRYRAIEHRSPLVRATNTGISAFVSATGEVASRLGAFREGVLFHEVPLVERGRTIYARFGYLFPWLLFVLAMIAFGVSQRRAAAAGGGRAAVD